MWLHQMSPSTKPTQLMSSSSIWIRGSMKQPPAYNSFTASGIIHWTLHQHCSCDGLLQVWWMCGGRWEHPVGHLPRGGGDEEDAPKAVWHTHQDACPDCTASPYRVIQSSNYDIQHTLIAVIQIVHTLVCTCLQYTVSGLTLWEEDNCSQQRGRGEVNSSYWELV